MSSSRVGRRPQLPDKLANIELIFRLVDLPLSITYFTLMIVAAQKQFDSQTIFPMVHVGVVLAIILDFESIVNTPGWTRLPQLSHALVGSFDFFAFLLVSVGWALSWLGSNWNNGEDPNREIPKTWADETPTYVLTLVLMVIHIIMTGFHWSIGCRNRKRRRAIEKEQRAVNMSRQPIKRPDGAVLQSSDVPHLESD